MGPPLTRRALFGLGLACTAFLAAALAPAEAPERLHVVLLHTNDLHGQVQPRPAVWLDREDPPPIGGLPRLAACVRRVRREAEESGSHVLLVDGGDWFQGTPEGSVEDGRTFVEALTKVGHDALVVGNHELDHGVEALADMIATYEVPALVANVFERAGGPRVSWAKPYEVVELGPLRVAVVGFITPVTPSITHPDASGLHFQAPADALTDLLPRLREEADWILPITHLGVVGDRRLAKAHPELEVIVGGHSHTYLKEGLTQGETFLVQAGSKASAVGRLDLWFDGETKELLERRYRILDLLEEPEEADRNTAVDEICAALVERSEREMNAEVGRLAEPLERTFRRVHSSPAGNLITDVLREALSGDVAIQNRGGIRCDLPAGPVTRRSLFELLPFGNHLVLLELTGQELFDCVRASVEGTAHTGLEVSGMTIVYRLEGKDPVLVDLEVGGRSLPRDSTVRLVTNNFLAGGGDGYTTLKQAKRLQEDPRLLREVLEARFRREGTVALPRDERYREAQP